jgi:site-specific recombinase XerD
MAGARSISHEESDALLNALGRERDRLLVLAGQHLGLRISELLSLRVRMVANGLVPKREITIARRQLKGGKSGRKGLHGRTIPVHPDLASAIAHYLANFPAGLATPDSFLFPSREGLNRPITSVQAWRVLKRAAVAGGLDADRISTHTLRKTFAHEVYEASGHDLRATQALLGHTEIETTVKYIEPEQDHLNKLVLGLASRVRPAAPVQNLAALPPLVLVQEPTAQVQVAR